MTRDELLKRLNSKGYELPQAASAAANYIPFQRSGKQLYIAGQLPFINGAKEHVGRLGDDLTIEQGQEAARACALNILAQIDQALNGDWTLFSKIIKLGGFVHASPDFTNHAQVLNGASDFIGELLAEAGRHARFAVGASSLPFGVAVEIDAIIELT